MFDDCCCETSRKKKWFSNFAKGKNYRQQKKNPSNKQEPIRTFVSLFRVSIELIYLTTLSPPKHTAMMTDDRTDRIDRAQKHHKDLASS